MGVAGRDPLPVRVPLLEEDWDHFAPLMESAVHRVPALEETGIHNGPDSFTPDNQFILGEAPEVRGLLRRRRLQLGRHRDGRRRRSGAGRVDRRGRADPRPDQCRRTPLRALQRQQPVAARPGRPRCSGCTTPSRGPTARCVRRGRSAARPSTPTSSRPTPTSAARWAGSAPTSSRPPARPDDRVLLGQAELAALDRTPSSAPPARTSPCSTRRRSRSTFSPVRTPKPLQWLCTADVAVPVGPYRLHRDAQRARHLRVGRHPDPRRVGRVLSLVSSSATTERDQDHITRRFPSACTRRSSTSPRSTPCSG